MAAKAPGKAPAKAQAKKAMPKIVSAAQWQKAHEAFLKKEKAATKAHDALAAERRRQPMTRIDKSYEFDGPAGRPNAKASLLDLFDGRGPGIQSMPRRRDPRVLPAAAPGMTSEK